MIYEDVIGSNGPYLCKDDRYRIILKFVDGKKKTVSYPKYLMEQYLNRYLEANETIDHIDGDPTNNDISNLRILDRAEHCANDCIRTKDVTVKCTYCGKEFTIPGPKVHYRNRLDRNQSGYFCSRSCSGKYGAAVQHGLIERQIREQIPIEHYKLHNYD